MSNFCRQIKLPSSLIRRLKHRSSNSMLSGRRSFTTTEGHRPSLVHKRSLDILHDPWFNKALLMVATWRYTNLGVDALVWLERNSRMVKGNCKHKGQK
ncbi:NAD-dependent malic enzyme 62 kDa isoform, mitochondrial [Vitis vinifera]|uniref:NAD-dependent malic enzyme 62 kDa isoform, mitochondrial n=1 Tax=Vitis vinifera TaxID=29760 RepID=A0A438BXD0_VITVI|nr:NAD-dependent malic enzyme 62 kDa isoform, mitochondrial [Vitis vinifera]